MSSSSSNPKPGNSGSPGDPTTDVPVSASESRIWQRVQLARHPKRPHSLDYIEKLFANFEELHGDRAFGDDPAIVAGLADFDGLPVAIVAQQKGRDTKQKLHRNFGMPKPEGYRKALRVMKLASKFRLPVISLIDTPGAYPGIDAEERGQAEAIAVNLREMSRLSSPVITVVIGEGGSGGALAMGVGNHNAILENATYSVISPESCAAIIYRDSRKAQLAAAALKMTAPELLRLQIVDEVIAEPGEGAHTDWDAAAALLRGSLSQAVERMSGWSAEELIRQRHEKYRRIASFFEETGA
ncbi:MAG: acetyl-CoA carboxylase carboxyltransferase subunit alpha [Bryobacterales bacterium]|nr:acetyl-CoA carboxylase carboxyltransferase subunit alpha [Bryobacterales bacterium]